MKKILIVSDLIGGPGGVYRQFELIEKHLGTRVSFLFLLDDSTEQYVNYNYSIANKKFIKLSSSIHNLKTIVDKFRKVIDKFNPDLIHIINGSIRSNLILREYCVDNKIPFIVTESLIDIKTNISEKLKRIQRVNKCTDLVIYVSKDSKEIAKNIFNIQTKKSVVVYNSAEPIIKKTTYSMQPFKLFTTARCSPQKGIDIIIRALAKTRHENITFHVFGDGEYREKYLSLAKKIIGNKHTFDILGWNKNLNFSYIGSEYDLFISASRSEGLSYSNLEAVSLGMPIICSKASGNTELLNLCKCGTLFNLENYEELADKIDEFLDNPIILNSKAITGSLMVDKLFNIDKNMSVLQILYEKYAG